MAQLLTWIASQQPLLMVMEDLHWADETSIRLFAFIGRRLATSTVLLVATAREEELAGAPALRRVLEELQRELSFDQFTLGPLSRPETLQLVRSLTRAGRADAPVARLGERSRRVWWTSPDVAERSYDGLRLMIYGASPIAEQTPRRAIEVFPCDFLQGYGMTETTAVLTYRLPSDHRRALREKPERLLSAGRPLPGTGGTGELTG